MEFDILEIEIFSNFFFAEILIFLCTLFYPEVLDREITCIGRFVMKSLILHLVKHEKTNSRYQSKYLTILVHAIYPCKL